MVLHNQPKSLYAQCHRWFGQYLVENVVKAGYRQASSNNQTLSLVRQKLRPFFLEHIPVVVRTSILEETGEFLFQKSLLAGVDCDYGRSILYLLHLLLSKEVKRLKVTLCCYYGCTDMEGVLRCIKKNGSSLEHLELSRSSLLRMDPFLFRNVLTSASNLVSLVVPNICSDAMLKLIGTHCCRLQYLDIANSKQVSDLGIESLCCQMQFRDRKDNRGGEGEITFRMVDQQTTPLTVREDYGGSNSNVGCSGNMPTWRDLRQKVRTCLMSGGGSTANAIHGGIGTNQDFLNDDVFVEFKQVLHPLCSTLSVFDITDTSVTNSGLLLLLKKLSKLQSLGEYTISEHFLRSLCVVSSMKIDTFGLLSVHTRKVSNMGMYNLVHVVPELKAMTCWEPQFDLIDLTYLKNVRQLTLLRINYDENVLRQLMKYIETSAANNMDKICLDFIVQNDFINAPQRYSEFDLGKIFANCQSLKVFSVEFKDSLMVTPPVGHSSSLNPKDLVCLSNLVHVQLGQIVLNSAVSVILLNCPSLRHLHCNTCPDLGDAELNLYSQMAKCTKTLECFYIYEAPNLTTTAFQTLLEFYPSLVQFGNLTRWAVNCEGIQYVVRTIRDNNYSVEILCGSHWFDAKCAQRIALPNLAD